MSAIFRYRRLLKSWLRAGLLFTLAALLAAARSHAQAVVKTTPLSGATIFLIRHAEKPEDGTGLTAAGENRARAYVDYFPGLRVDKHPVKLEHLFAAADSKNSARSRLTIEPLSRALRLPLDQRFAADEFPRLADEIYARDHGRGMLICWHHGTIPGLLAELGVDPARVLPDGEWPKDVFNWVIVLRFDAAGRLMPKHSERITMRWVSR